MGEIIILDLLNRDKNKDSNFENKLLFSSGNEVFLLVILFKIVRMKFLQLIVLILFVVPMNKSWAQQKNYTIHTIAFYNFENLFDTINDPNTNDDEWTPKGAQHWTSKKYHQKLQNLSRVLFEIGSSDNPNAPTFIGGSEIENRGVLEDLVQQAKLANKDYGIIHF